MLWVRNEVESEQVALQSADITAALLRLLDRSILVASVYVDGKEGNVLGETIILLDQLIQDTRHRVGTRVDVVLVGDFNAHDQLWGGDDISPNRQGEADPIIDLMTEWSLRSLLRRGTRTWEKGAQTSTIDLTFASHKLASSLIRCGIHPTEHGSDHRAIETMFDVETPANIVSPRLAVEEVARYWKFVS